MPLPQRAVPVDESDSELDSAGTEPSAPFLRPDTYPPALDTPARGPDSALVFDEHGELARVQSPAHGASAYTARPTAHSWAHWRHVAAATVLPSSAAPATLTPPALLSAASAQIALRIAAIFVLSTAAVVAGLWTLPLPIPAHGITRLTITEIRNISLALQTYATRSLSAALHTWAVLLAFFTWKQAWSVPGSVISNVLLGMIYGTYVATLYTSFFTATGGVLCYLLARPVGPIIERLPGFRKPLDAMRRALALPPHAQPHSQPQTAQQPPAATVMHAKKVTPVISQGPMLSFRRSSASASASALASDPSAMPQGMSTLTYLLFLRLVPIVPWSAMNICCAVLGVPLWPYWASFLLGSVPWNFVTTQVGDILQDLLAALPPDGPAQTQTQPETGTQVQAPGVGSPASGLSTIKAKIWSREMVLKLTLLTLASLAPMALQWWVKRRRAASSASAAAFAAAEAAAGDQLTSDLDLALPGAEGEAAAVAGAGTGAGAARPLGSSSLFAWPQWQRRTCGSDAAGTGLQLLPKPASRTPGPSLGPGFGGGGGSSSSSSNSSRSRWADVVRTPSPFGQLLRLASPTPHERDVESSPGTEDEPALDTPTSLGSVLSASQYHGAYPCQQPFQQQQAQQAQPVAVQDELAFRSAPAAAVPAVVQRGGHGRKPQLPPLTPLSPHTAQAIAAAAVEEEWGAGPARTPSPMQALAFARDRERAFALSLLRPAPSSHTTGS